MPIWLPVLWRAAKPFLPYVALALAVTFFLIAIENHGYHRGLHKRDAEVAALTGTIANLKAASAQALADNHAQVARINTLQDQITKEQDDAIKESQDAAHSAVLAYARLHPAQANPGRAGSDRASGIPGPASQPDATPDQTIVPVTDLDACAKAYVTATGLQDWVRKEAAVQR